MRIGRVDIGDFYRYSIAVRQLVRNLPIHHGDSYPYGEPWQFDLIMPFRISLRGFYQNFRQQIK